MPQAPADLTPSARLPRRAIAGRGSRAAIPTGVPPIRATLADMATPRACEGIGYDPVPHPTLFAEQYDPAYVTSAPGLRAGAVCLGASLHVR